MNTQLSSTWRLAYRTFKKAVGLTFSIMIHGAKANHYSTMVHGKLEEQRKLYKKIEEAKNESIIPDQVVS